MVWGQQVDSALKFNMGRKQRRGAKQAGIPHKEAFQRMNYLYQAALASLAASPSEPQLSRFYVHTMRTIGKRLVLRMDPSIKRSLCKSCDTLLVPGITCTQRLRSHREKHMVVKCLTCGTLKRFLAHRDHQLWSERPENTAAGTGSSVEEFQECTTSKPQKEKQQDEEDGQQKGSAASSKGTML